MKLLTLKTHVPTMIEEVGSDKKKIEEVGKLKSFKLHVSNVKKRKR